LSTAFSTRTIIKVDLKFTFWYGSGDKNSTNKEIKTMERTLSIIKPDGVAKNVIGEVIKRIESNKLN
jgi:hypothetical protein